ncbi:sodium:solute symporter family protein [Thermovenabulum gondwanense]|uniref:Sodium/proline symporter n=1 Tax=Thermovenabulum gondwanense TaxID=520767 RepID=A0A162MU91_9FIRM|nr:sodium:solute symporter family protein [Thermovenabulum gondwanense]KYO67353.1 Sodium/proline symporter [Thermovenabulum gondwanense]
MKFFILFLYILSQIVVGIIGMKKTKNLNDFLLAGRNMGPWMSAFAYGTAYFSAVIFIGYAGKIGWGFGLSGLWIAIGNSLIGGYLAWRVLAKPTKEITRRLNVRTLPELLAARYNSPFYRIFSAFIIFIFLVPYSASVYMGLSYLFESVFNINYQLALIIMAGLTAFYLILGGYFAVSLSDFIQGIIMFSGSLIMVYSITSHPSVGGLVSGIRKLYQINPKLVSPVGPPGFWPLFFLVVLTSLGPWGLPQMVHKFYSIKDEKSIKPATVITTVFSLVISFTAYFIGSMTRLFFTSIPLEGGKPNPDLMVPKIIQMAMPEAIAAIILALVISASMSTLSSLVLISSSAVSIDLIEGLGIKISGKSKVTLMRLFCLIFIGLSLIIAILKPSIIITLMAISWGTVAGTFLAPYVFGLFRKDTTKLGAWAGSLTGLAISLGLSIIYKFDSGKIPMFGSLAMLLPLIVVPVVSKLDNLFITKRESLAYHDIMGSQRVEEDF